MGCNLGNQRILFFACLGYLTGFIMTQQEETVLTLSKIPLGGESFKPRTSEHGFSTTSFRYLKSPISLKSLIYQSNRFILDRKQVLRENTYLKSVISIKITFYEERSHGR